MCCWAFATVIVKKVKNLLPLTTSANQRSELKALCCNFASVSENMTTCLHGTENHRMTYIKHYPFCNTCNFDINKEKILLLILLADKFQIAYLQQFHHIHSNLLVQPYSFPDHFQVIHADIKNTFNIANLVLNTIKTLF